MHRDKKFVCKVTQPGILRSESKWGEKREIVPRFYFVNSYLTRNAVQSRSIIDCPLLNSTQTVYILFFLKLAAYMV